MLILPHTVTRHLAEENVEAASLRVNGVSYGAPEAHSAMLAPVSATSAFEQYGVEMARPFLLLWEPGDRARYPVGTLVTESRGMFTVKSATMSHEFGNAADHCSCVCEQMEVEPEGVLHMSGDGAGMAGMGMAGMGGVVRNGGDIA